MMINEICTYAPYTYVNKQKTVGYYNLYILVPVEAGKTIQFPLKKDLFQQRDKTVIEGKVINGSDNIVEVAAGRFAKKYYSLDKFDNVPKITVFVKNGNTSNHSNTYLFEDADDFHNDIGEEGLALNSPYSYLTNAATTFYPRMLLTLMKTTYSSEKESVSSDNEDVTSLVTLEKDIQTTTIDIVSPNKVNASEFGANFELVDFEVLVEGTASLLADKKRKGRKRKASSDPS